MAVTIRPLRDCDFDTLVFTFFNLLLSIVTLNFSVYSFISWQHFIFFNVKKVKQVKTAVNYPADQSYIARSITTTMTITWKLKFCWLAPFSLPVLNVTNLTKIKKWLWHFFLELTFLSQLNRDHDYGL